MMINFAHLLLDKRMPAARRRDEVLRAVTGQETFDELFAFLFHHERLLIIRSAEMVEKLTLTNRGLLAPHKRQLMMLLRSAVHNELKWHLALLISRAELDDEERREAASILSYWALNPNESTRVRMNAVQGLYDLGLRYADVRTLFSETARTLAHDPTPAVQRRAGKLVRMAGNAATVDAK